MARDPASAVQTLYAELSDPRADALSALVHPGALQQHQDKMIARLRTLSMHAEDRQERVQFLKFFGADATEALLHHATGAELLALAMKSLPPAMRAERPRVLGTVHEPPLNPNGVNPNRAWVMFRLEYSANFDSTPPPDDRAHAAGLRSGYILTEEEFLSGDNWSAFDDNPPMMLETRLVNGNWIVSQLAEGPVPLPGMPGLTNVAPYQPESL